MVRCWVRCNPDRSLRHRRIGACVRREEISVLSFLTAAAASGALTQFAEGAALAASVYAISRGLKK